MTNRLRQHVSTFGSETTTQRLIPIMPPCILDCADPGKIKGIFRHLEFAHGGIAKFCFSQKLRLIASHEWKQPISATSAFFVGLFREFLASTLGHSERLPDTY